MTRYQIRLQAYMLMLTPEYPWGWKGDSAYATDASTPPTNGITRFNFVLVGAAQAWIWVWIVLGGPVLYFCALHLVFASSMRYRIPGEMPALGLAAIGWIKVRGWLTARSQSLVN